MGGGGGGGRKGRKIHGYLRRKRNITLMMRNVFI